jgi:hypothetical protein
MTDEENNNNDLPSHGVKLVNRNNLSYRVTQLEKWMEKHDMDNCRRIEQLDERVDKQDARTSRYYSVITPEEIKDILEVTHRNEIDIKGVSERFNDFQQDRLKRLEVANEKIDTLKDEIRDAENRINAKVDKNKIKSQQYVIGVVVGLIVTFIASGVIAFLKF